MNRTTGLTLANETDHIRQSVSDILLTPIGSRLQRREYGSQLFELIDRPLSMALALQISAASVIALKKWEPRINVSRFKVNFDPNAPSSITAEMDAILKESQTPITLDNLKLR